MGLGDRGFLGLGKLGKKEIVGCVENDLVGGSKLEGFVEDEGGGLMGGVCGNGGLLCRGEDVGKIGEMWVEKGMWGEGR